MLRTAGRTLFRHRACRVCLAWGHAPPAAWGGQRRALASVQEPVQEPDAADEERVVRRPIREVLRELDTSQALQTGPRAIVRDQIRVGSTENSMTRVENRSLVEIDDEGDGSGGGPEDGLLSGWGGGGEDRDNVASSLERPYGAVAPQAGDLVEVSTDSWRIQLLAVCLGNFRGVDHFYTNTGKWFVSSGVRSLFGVTGFATTEELAPVVAALPAESVAEAAGETSDPEALDDMLNRLQELRLGPSREAGAGLIRKMNGFAEQAASIHMAHAAVLDNAFQVLQQATAPADKDRGRDRDSCMMTLEQMAAVLLRKGGHKLHGARHHHNTGHGHSAMVRRLPNTASSRAKSSGRDEFTAEAMYAVHRAIMMDELAFRPMGSSSGSSQEDTESHSRTCMFEVASVEDMETVRTVERMAREFSEANSRAAMRRMPDVLLRQTALGSFAIKARKVIDHSRKTRQWLPYGMIGPWQAVEEGTDEASKALPKLVGGGGWDESDKQILFFMQQWAGFERFSRASRLHWVGAAVLRAVDRYAASEAEYLDTSTGWTFLQEVGWVRPWDLPARYRMRLPDVRPTRSGKLARQFGGAPDLGLGDDVFAGRRREWAEVTTYCIDAPEAADIDDGVSLERTEDPDMFWIHVHVADPGSCIRPDSALGQMAAQMPQTAYLPGFEERMLPDDAVRERFSLGPGQPCLTFSAQVDRQGAVRATAITPGRLRDVVFITPDEVASVVATAEAEAVRTRNDGSSSSLLPPAHLDLPWARASFSVGEAAESDDPDEATGRTMTTAAELSAAARADLETLSMLATGLRAVRLANGAMPLYWPRPSVAVQLPAAAAAAADGPNKKGRRLPWVGDPQIRIWYEDADKAGGTAGSRLVESLMRLAGEVAADWCHARDVAIPFRGQPDAARHREALATLTRSQIYPALSAGRRPDETALRSLRRLLGADDITAVAVPHVTMGVARYTKATSPLRRYSDLVVHWQVEGALRAEETGGETGPPFTRADLEHRVLPQLRVRERALRGLDNRVGRDQWMLQALVRGWLADPAAFARLRLVVTGVDARRGRVRGRLDWFERAAVLDAASLNGNGIASLRFDAVRPGMVLDVALEHVDVHANLVLVRRVGPLM